MEYPCPMHGESKMDQVQKVLSRLSDEELCILTDADPLKIANAVSLIAGHRFLTKIHALKAEYGPLLR